MFQGLDAQRLVALFVAGLAFPVGDHPHLLAAGKIGTLTGSMCSAAIGTVVLLVVLRRPTAPAAGRG